MKDSHIPIIGAAREPEQTIEICRSFSYKLNLQNYGGNAYESSDFFASRKITVARSQASTVSEEIYQECVEEVKKAIAHHIAVMAYKSDRKKERQSA